ncbi:MAG: hypothetical protein KKB37_00355 [Alphaproteobacteria bacterium]|nr:hypothetical protein [Alphaproteobacteria bacterium]
MASPLPTITVLGQAYTVDVHAKLVRNVGYPSEVFSFNEFYQIAAQAETSARAEQAEARLAEAQAILRAFIPLMKAALEPDVLAILPAPSHERGDAAKPARRTKRTRSQDR